ncbi:unnamed protein product [Ostreobium quekettii]|uniref:Thioredoxin domain-containing protein n=1 Tax=Ostreobium quekettii TaxID=121088 RepID=A0A8S1IZ17_9CHLO|nr:unnamed protein product [Ostreobium quekettii]|eukprot:evm.model.scf_248EXC.14 EVM.evm.TU.scf_248EXC.14   scf_248EXC:94855-97836(-)
MPAPRPTGPPSTPQRTALAKRCRKCLVAGRSRAAVGGRCSVRRQAIRRPSGGHAQAIPESSRAPTPETRMPPSVVSREEWNAARQELLAAEKALTRQRDEVSRQRRALPWVALEKDYTLQDADGRPVRFSELFRDGKADLVVYHFMYDPAWQLPCDHCCCWAEGYNAYAPFLADKFNFAVVAKAPADRLKLVMAMKGWSLPMYSSGGSDFNADFHVENTVMKCGGREVPLSQGPGLNVFRKEGSVVYHTYSTYGRGLEVFNAIWAFLDVLPNGREGWHPKHKHLYRKRKPIPDGEDSKSRKRDRTESRESKHCEDHKAES